MEKTKPIEETKVKEEEIKYLVIRFSDGKYGCYVCSGKHGLAFFTKKENAYRFLEYIVNDDSTSEIIPVGWEDLFDIAFERKLFGDMKINCIVLLDDINSPRIYDING